VQLRFAEIGNLLEANLFTGRDDCGKQRGAPFVEVQLAPTGAEPQVQARALESTTIEVRLRNGRSLMVPVSFEARHLRALLAVVESC